MVAFVLLVRRALPGRALGYRRALKKIRQDKLSQNGVARHSMSLYSLQTLDFRGFRADLSCYNSIMIRRRRGSDVEPAIHSRDARIPRAAIRRFAREVGRRFHPQKIILFGSYAYGRPNADSDVDILVVMPTRSELDQAVKICWEVPFAFPMDLIVRTPRHLERQLADGDSFHTLIVTKGKTLYEKVDEQAKGSFGLAVGWTCPRRLQSAARDLVASSSISPVKHDRRRLT